MACPCRFGAAALRHFGSVHWPSLLLRDFYLTLRFLVSCTLCRATLLREARGSRQQQTKLGNEPAASFVLTDAAEWGEEGATRLIDNLEAGEERLRNSESE